MSHLFDNQVLRQLLAVWGDKSSLKHTSYEQHLYLSRAIMVALSYLSEQDRATFREGETRSLFQYEDHLSRYRDSHYKDKMLRDGSVQYRGNCSASAI